MKTMMVKFPGYVYMAVTPAQLQALLNAPLYEYDWQKKTYWRADVLAGLEFRVADDDEFQLTTKPEETVDEK